MGCDLSELIGKTLSDVKVDTKLDIIYLICTDGSEYKMFNNDYADVQIDDICGNIENLIGAPILFAEEATNDEIKTEKFEAPSFIWTFYKFATVKGWVDIRWFGCSNGCYSEKVMLQRIKKGRKKC